ncbi:hypothetical protein OQZ33_16000 [Pedobacter sp. MC2016-05]|nr:hypothetical protein [Pedobacter sp. MC2016-05]MCX2475835.1 hypothetical protein [Pedobacter sp. MC2016-05]
MKNIFTERLRIFTWDINGSYLLYLFKGDYEIYISIDSERYGG